MMRLPRAFALIVAVLSLLVADAAQAPSATAAPALSLQIFPTDPSSAILAGHIDGVDPGIAFVTVTATLDDGSSLSLNVDSSTNWNFSFGVLPTDGWVGISITENPIPMPLMYTDQWDFGYMYGYYYAYPTPGVAWTSFPGYTYPVGYGWSYYPFGAYAWAQHLQVNYGVPFYWTYAPVTTTETYTYYGVAGLVETYVAPAQPPVVFGTLYQPQYLRLAAPPAIYSTSVNVAPVVYSAAKAADPPKDTTIAAQAVKAQASASPVLVSSTTVSSAAATAPTATGPAAAPAAQAATATPSVSGNVATPAATSVATPTVSLTATPVATPQSAPAATATPMAPAATSTPAAVPTTSAPVGATPQPAPSAPQPTASGGSGQPTPSPTR